MAFKLRSGNSTSFKMMGSYTIKKVKTILKGVGKIASRFAGPVVVYMTALDVYDAAKWTYKNRKELAKHGKKVQKEKFERSKGGFDPFTAKY